VRETGVAPHRCPSIGPDAAGLVDVLRSRFDREEKRFTAKELLEEVGPRHGGRAVTVEALQAYLHTHRATLGLRAFEEIWTLVRRPTITLAAGQNPSTAMRHAGA
jgi:hypothetical protein